MFNTKYNTPTIRCLLAGTVLLAFAATASAQQTQTGFVSRVFKDDSGDHKYSVFLPANYTPAKKWPTILFLHGAGERGTDGQLQLTVGLGPIVKARAATFPYIVVFPQSEDVKGRLLTGWLADSPDGQRALKILDQVEKDYSVDPKHEILTGWSMGAYGTWSLAAAHPDRFSAIVPVAGGADVQWADALKKVPTWAWHGAKDTAVLPAESRKIIEAIRKAGGHPQYTELPEADHNVWKEAYSSDALYAWMLNPAKAPASRPAVAARPTHPRVSQAPQPPVEAQPFVPALDIHRAAYVRLGNDMLAALSDAIPQLVPRESLTGMLPNISSVTQAQGRSFNVTFSSLSYSAQLTRAVVKAYAPGRLNVQLGLSNAQIVIGGTSVTGDRHWAQAGPISIVIGHQRPVWLSFDVKPVVENRKLKLQLLGTRFSIPNDNWYVTAPAGVSTHGFGMTRDRVTDGLVSGLYGSKSRIEQQVGSVVPGLLSQLESKLDLSKANDLVAGLWPLPVYQPRIVAWPSEVSTDANGVSVVLGITAAQIDPKKHRRWTATAPIGPAAKDVPQTTNLQVGVAPELLGPLTDLLIEADLAHIHVLDAPAKSLAKFVDPAVMTELIPDLKRHGDKLELWSELVLVEPLKVVNASQSDAASNQPATGTEQSATGKTVPARPVAQSKSGSALVFQLPKFLITVAYRTDSKSQTWTPCAEFEMSLSQRAHPELVKPNSQTRGLLLAWNSDPKVEATARFASGYKAEDTTLNADRAEELFATGWKEFVQQSSLAHARLPDIDVGFSKLRAQEVAWSTPDLTATYGPAGIRITNGTDKPFRYETKGPYSGWGGPYTLAPGADHYYPLAYPVLFRSQTATGPKLYTLPAGSHSEYFVPQGYQDPGFYQAPERPVELVPPPQAAAAK